MERTRQPPRVERRRGTSLELNRVMIESGKYMPREAADAVLSNPPLVRIDHDEYDEAKISGREHRECGGGQSQLRTDLRPVAQSPNEGPGRQLIGHHDLIAGIKPDARKLIA